MVNTFVPFSKVEVEQRSEYFYLYHYEVSCQQTSLLSDDIGFVNFTDLVFYNLIFLYIYIGFLIPNNQTSSLISPSLCYTSVKYGRLRNV